MVCGPVRVGKAVKNQLQFVAKQGRWRSLNWAQGLPYSLAGFSSFALFT